MEVECMYNVDARFKGVTPVAKRVRVLRDLMPCCLVETCIAGTFCCHFEGGRCRLYLPPKHTVRTD